MLLQDLFYNLYLKIGGDLEGLFDIASEAAVLGCCLAYPGEVMDEVVLILEKSDFYLSAHQVLFESFCDMHEHGSAIDVVTVHNYLQSIAMAETIGSPGILSEILTGFSTHFNVREYVSIVKNKSRLRQLDMACRQIMSDIRDKFESPMTLMEKAQSLIFDTTSTHQTYEQPFESILKKVTDDVIEWTAQGGGLRGVTTGFETLDKLLNGWRPKQLVVIGGSMGIGKSALVMTFARHILRQGHPLGMFSMEMSDVQLAIRILSGEAIIGSRPMFSGELGIEQIQTLQRKAQEIKGWPFYLDCTQGLDIRQMRSRARRWKRKYGIKFVIIDFAQIVRSRKFEGDKTQEVSDVARNCMEMAHELDLTVFLLSQLNTASDEIPSKTSLKDSKSLAESADIILLLSKQSKNSEENKNHYCLHLAKQREGPDDIRLTIEYLNWRTHFREPISS